MRFAVGALLLALAATTFADPPSNPTSADEVKPNTSATARQDSQLPEVTIRAQREAIAKQAHTFVRRVSGSTWSSDEDRRLGMWRARICPLLAGLPAAQGQFIFHRLEEVIAIAGAHQDVAGCHPNLIILVTTQPEALLSAWYKRDRRMFAAAMPHTVQRFLGSSLPIRMWYSMIPVGADGDLGQRGSGAAGDLNVTGGSSSVQTLLDDIPVFRQVGGIGRLGSRIGLGAAHDLNAVIVVVDFRQMEGIDWGQLADYIAMAALTNVDTDSNFADTPSILALFSAPVAARPAGLTDWDRSYLRALYHTDRMSPQQRLLIAEQIMRDMDPARATAAP